MKSIFSKVLSCTPTMIYQNGSQSRSQILKQVPQNFMKAFNVDNERHTEFPDNDVCRKIEF